MKLSSYLANNSISEAQFAERIGVSRQTINRYTSNDRVPDDEILARIFEATGGAVQPNDFFPFLDGAEDKVGVSA